MSKKQKKNKNKSKKPMLGTTDLFALLIAESREHGRSLEREDRKSKKAKKRYKALLKMFRSEMKKNRKLEEILASGSAYQKTLEAQIEKLTSELQRADAKIAELLVSNEDFENENENQNRRNLEQYSIIKRLRKKIKRDKKRKKDLKKTLKDTLKERNKLKVKLQKAGKHVEHFKFSPKVRKKKRHKQK